MTTVTPPDCFRCKHFRDDPDGPRCRAFPDGIPAPIWLSERMHRTPYPGDHGIQFDALDEPRP